MRPAPVLADGAGDALRRALPEPDDFGVLLLRARHGLATGAVFAEADRQGLARDRADLAARLAAVERAAATAPFGLPADLLVNDLEPAARALSHEVGAALDAAARRRRRRTCCCAARAPPWPGCSPTRRPPARPGPRSARGRRRAAGRPLAPRGGTA